MRPALDGRPANILLVDDDEDDQIATKRALAKGKIRNDLYIVNNGEEAMDFLKHRGSYADPRIAPWPDLVLLDLNMPKMDGRETLAAIRADPALRGLVVVILTTSSQEEDIMRSYDVGCNSFISKPVDAAGFASLIQDLEHYWLQVVVLPTK